MSRTEFADDGHAYFSDRWPGPAVQVRFEDGVLVEFRPATEWPQIARVSFRGLAVKGLLLDADAGIGPDGDWRNFSTWKTGVTGADGAYDVPGEIREAALRLCKRRAKEARSAMWTAGRGPGNAAKPQKETESGAIG